MELGNFSVSLAVKDIKASRKFYEALGFEAIDDHEAEKWLIMQNGTAIIGLFEGMFDKNTLTFNPSDVRNIQQDLKGKGIKLIVEADETSTGPAYTVLTDPDGNPVLLDQHDPNYKPNRSK